ncbi:MAG: hypothetical protein QM704_11200 [Anaeromyxobacteraceae bacterium]
MSARSGARASGATSSPKRSKSSPFTTTSARSPCASANSSSQRAMTTFRSGSFQVAITSSCGPAQVSRCWMR